MRNPDELLEKLKFYDSRITGSTVIRTLPFLDGELLILECGCSGGTPKTLYYYPNTDKLFPSVDEVVIYQSSKSKKRQKIDLLYIGFVPGFIAIVITTTIVYIALINTERNSEYEIPDILSNTLATIIGFYFGSQLRPPAGVREHGTGNDED